MDRDGYDKEGYDLKGFDRNGFDMQGYNVKGEYFEFIDKHINENTSISIKNNSFIYSDEIRELFVEIDRAKRSIEIEDFIAAISHLRRVSESYLEKVLLLSNVLPYKFIDLNQYERINLANYEGLINDNDKEILHWIRINGNDAVHSGKGDKETAIKIMDELQKQIYKWIEIHNK